MKIAVSACLLGENCRYDGGNCYREQIEELLKGHEIVAVCPEKMAGLSTPRIPCEIFNGRVLRQDGKDITEQLEAGVQKALNQIGDVQLCVLKSYSPTCGHGSIYDGTFQKRRIQGSGLFAKALKDKGILIVEVD